MATKAISIEIDAYELLAREKKDRTESFSRVIRPPHCSRAAERRRRQSVSLRLANGAPADFLATSSRRKRCVDRRDRASRRGDRGWPRARLCTSAATRIFDVLIAAYIVAGSARRSMLELSSIRRYLWRRSSIPDHTARGRRKSRRTILERNCAACLQTATNN